MLERLQPAWSRAWRALCRRFHKFRRPLIIVGVSLAVLVSVSCFVFTGPGNPFLPSAWRARLTAAKLADSIASGKICHEDCLRERLVWRQAIIAYGDNELSARLDQAISDSDENLYWRVEALTILSKLPKERLPSNLSWPTALAAGAPPELAVAAYELFPGEQEALIRSIRLAVENGDDSQRLAALRALLREPDALPADWYLKIAETGSDSRLRLTALQALSNFKSKPSAFSALTLEAMDKLWQDASLPLHARRLLAMLATDYGGIDKAAAEKRLEGWLDSSLSDKVTDVFITENLRRYFGTDIPIPVPSASEWEDYDQADPFLKI